MGKKWLCAGSNESKNIIEISTQVLILRLCNFLFDNVEKKLTLVDFMKLTAEYADTVDDIDTNIEQMKEFCNEFAHRYQYPIDKTKFCVEAEEWVNAKISRS